jgi:hypothetical protein
MGCKLVAATFGKAIPSGQVVKGKIDEKSTHNTQSKACDYQDKK